MLKHSDTRVRIEGHTDDRGATEYNIALSERRAHAVKRYLRAMGVEERAPQHRPLRSRAKPADTGSSEAAHAANRRAEFKPL